MTQLENNKITLCGTVCSDAIFSHEVFGEKFYCADLSVKRMSGQCDILPIVVSERLCGAEELSAGRRVYVEGQLRSYNIVSEVKTDEQPAHRSKLQLQTFVRELRDAEDDRDINCISLDGYICKPPVYRVTPFAREIADVLVAVNRAYGKSDYIPIICWGRAARYCKQLTVGNNIAIEGRLQSRNYQKKISEDNVVSRIAYEVSVAKLAYKPTETFLNDEDSEENVEE